MHLIWTYTLVSFSNAVLQAAIRHWHWCLFTVDIWLSSGPSSPEHWSNLLWDCSGAIIGECNAIRSTFKLGSLSKVSFPTEKDLFIFKFEIRQKPQHGFSSLFWATLYISLSAIIEEILPKNNETNW
jgi:hypothetical protein